MKLKEIPSYIKWFLKFITEDIWRTIPQDLSEKERRFNTILKVIVLSVKRYQTDHLQRSASALTYSTFLSLIPLLAVLLAIAKGFGFSNIVESQLFQSFPGQKQVLIAILEFVDLYMQQTKEGIFLGLGLLLLFYTVYNLIANIENTFNMIWQVSKERPFVRKFTDYFSVFLIIPLFLVCSSGLSIWMATAFNTLKEYLLIAPIFEIIITIAPVIISIFVFTALYMFMPNTSVRFMPAFCAGIFAAIGFHTFQYLYINGQIWVSKYNAIYGSFAVLPLLLLWMQLSWVICLIGAEIAYAVQNVQNFEFETDSKNISRRYFDFLTLAVASLIVKRFEKGEEPCSAVEISTHYQIPIRLTQRILYLLIDLKIINVVNDEHNLPHYQPAIDIHQITVEYLFNKIDRYGSENFKIDSQYQLHSEWEIILQCRRDMFSTHKNLLIKDL
ncbi:MAG: YihY/virulence factor BrkB family protein [Candidatus Azobacteroides sp.]|nr:YihY/virulence factor BrkB family protein [Candidatus Azobacteroides sp.]